MNKELTQVETEQHLRLKRLRYRSWHRGLKETDLVLGSFSDRHLSELSAQDLSAYEKMLDENDADIWDWLTGKEPPAHVEYEPILTLLRTYTPAA